MDLKHRLAQYDSLAKKARPETVDSAAATAPTLASQSGDAPPWAAALGLRLRATDGGEIWIAEGQEPRPHRVDREQLGSLSLVLTSSVPQDLAPDEILLLDTETTGLVGGTGSLAFLVGCAWWEGEAWRWRQYFLPAPGRETPLLRDVAALASRFRVIVTFNGAVFDLPLLRTRALMSRMPDPLGSLASWDLLPVSRRLWGRRLPDCRQQTVEAHAADRPRAAAEIDGALIPHVYFDFLRTGSVGLLPAVLTRNRHDLEGMAAVLAAAAQRTTLIERAGDGPGDSPAAAATLTATQAATGIQEPAAGMHRIAIGIHLAATGIHWADAWSAGRLCERAGRHAHAAAWLKAAIRGRWEPASVGRATDDPQSDHRADSRPQDERDATEHLSSTRDRESAWQRRSRTGGRLTARSLPNAATRPSRDELLFRDAVRLLKRLREWPTVETILRTALDTCGGRPWLHREAAILYEHRLRRLDLALPHAERLGDPDRLVRLRARLKAKEEADPTSRRNWG